MQKRKQIMIQGCFAHICKTVVKTEIENLSAEELNERCCTFVLTVRKKDANEYEPSTLK
jgi:hypothetical protein